MKVVWMILFIISLMWGGYYFIRAKYYQDQILQMCSSKEKFKLYFNIMDKWMTMCESQKEISTYFVDNGYQRIAIYGMGRIAYHLIEALKSSSLCVAYGIDKMAAKKNMEIQVYFPDTFPQEADVIVVTTNEFIKIKECLEEVTNIPIVSLEEIISYMNMEGENNVM